MIAAIGWGIACIQLVIIIVLIKALDTEHKEKNAIMKWTIHREILRKFYEENQ